MIRTKIACLAVCLISATLLIAQPARRALKIPERYVFEGITIHAPRVFFAYPPFIRSHLIKRFPQLIVSAMEPRDKGALQIAFEQLKAKLDQSKHALQKYREDTKAVALEDSRNTVDAGLRDLNMKLTEAKTVSLRLESDYAQVREIGNEVPEHARIGLKHFLEATRLIGMAVAESPENQARRRRHALRQH